jgi:thioredoxin reductase (NADPH)
MNSTRQLFQRLTGSSVIRSSVVLDLFSSQVPVASCSTMSEPASIKMHTKVCIVGSGPAAHTAAIYAARAELKPILFEGWMANGIAAGGQLTTTTDMENFTGFPGGIMGDEMVTKFREQSLSFGTEVFTKTVEKIDFSKRPFELWTDSRHVTASHVCM